MYFKTSNSKSNIISFDVLSGVRLETEIWVTLRASFELSHFSSGLLMSTLWYMQRILIAERKFNFFKVCNWACRAVHFPTEILSVTLSPFSMFSWNMINFAESCCFFLYPIACGRVILIKSQIPAHIHVSAINSKLGAGAADPGFFSGGGALVSCSTSTPINHIVFLAEYQLC